MSSFASRLPRTPSELDIVLGRKSESGSHKDFKVRHSKVLHALQRLKENKYRSIDIDDIALQQLPEDGNLVHFIPTIHDEEPDGYY